MMATLYNLSISSDSGVILELRTPMQRGDDPAAHVPNDIQIGINHPVFGKVLSINACPVGREQTNHPTRAMRCSDSMVSAIVVFLCACKRFDTRRVVVGIPNDNYVGFCDKLEKLIEQHMADHGRVAMIEYSGNNAIIHRMNRHL